MDYTKNEEKKARTKKLVILISLVVVMILSVSLTWAFWQGDLVGSGNDTSNNITIGDAGDTTTVLTLDNSANAGTPGRLIPQHSSITGQTGDIRYATFTFEVQWVTASGAQNPTLLDNRDGNLVVTIPSIMIGGNDFRATRGFEETYINNGERSYRGDVALFNVSVAFGTPPGAATDISNGAAATSAATTIRGHSAAASAETVTVTVTVAMNIPLTQTVYNQITNSTMTVAFNFAVTPIPLP